MTETSIKFKAVYDGVDYVFYDDGRAAEMDDISGELINSGWWRVENGKVQFCWTNGSSRWFDYLGAVQDAYARMVVELIVT